MYFLAMAVSSETRPSSVPGAEIRRGKKARLSNSCTRSCKESSGFDEIKLFCKDFNEGFTGFKVPAGCGRSNKDLWVDKYAPRCLEELAVHKKKEECSNRVLLISGQAGVGKSATIHVIASHLEATVCEWNMPTPTIWQEHLHNSNSDQDHTSHVANGKVAYRRLHSCLHFLVQSARIPTAILITEYGTADSADKTCTWEELQLSLQSAGACKVAFNPITVNSIKKTLSKICREEQCKLTADQIDLIAKSSGGDIRQAITSLQYFCLKSRPKLYAFPTVLPLIQKKDHMGSIVWMMGFLYHLAEMKLFLYFCTTRGRLRILLHWVCTDGTHNFRY